MKPATAASLLARRGPLAVGLVDRRQQQRPALGEELVEHLVLGVEVVVDEAVGDARLVGDVGDAGRVEALAGEDADRRVEDLAALVDRRRAWRHQARASAAAASRRRRGGGWRARAATRGSAPGRRGRGRRRRSTPRRAPSPARRPRGRRSSSGRRSCSAAAPRRPGSAAMTKTWFSIARARSSTSQWSRPVARGEGRRDGDQAGAAHGEDPVELGEAQVVTDGQPDRRARRAAR